MARVTRSRRSAYSTGTGRKSSRRTQAQHLAEDVDDEERNINGTSSAVDVEAACAGPCRWVEDASRCDALCAGLCKLRINELVPRRVVENLIARGTTGAAGCLELVDFCGVDKVDDALLAKIAATSISPVQSSSSTPSVSAQCQLRAIQLSKCYRVTDAGICHVAATCPLLEKLLLAGCPRVTDVGLADVMKRHNCRLTTLAITPSLGGITASGVAALFEPFTRKPAGAGAEVEVDAKTISARQAWPLRQLLLQEPRFDDAATGWKTVFEALWAYRCNACVGKPQPREEAFVLRLASPHGFTDQVVEQFLASADRSAAPKATTGPEVAAAKVKVEIAGKHDLSEACVERLQAAFLS